MFKMNAIASDDGVVPKLQFPRVVYLHGLLTLFPGLSYPLVHFILRTHLIISE